jgi:glycosyltransferase involved in cell wall biosynthesis
VANDKPERVLLILQSTEIGGMETTCVDSAAEFARRGIAVTVIVPEGRAFDVVEQRVVDAGATPVRLDTDARHGRAGQLRRWLRLLRFLRRWSPSVIHLHTGGTTGGLAPVLAGRVATSAIVGLTEHDVPNQGNAGLRNRLVKRAMDRACHFVVSVSRRNAAIRYGLLGGRGERMAAVTNGVPIGESSLEAREANRERVRRDLGIARDVTLVGCAVRLAEDKGLRDLVRATALVQSAAPCEVLLVGEGPLRDELAGEAENLGLAGKLHFAGYQANPGPYFDAMDIFVLAVPAGSMSIALLEAMARGLPSIIAYCGPEEPIIDGETGLCAPPRDPQGLANQLERLVLDRELRDRIGGAAARHVRLNYSIKRVVDDLLDVYDRARSEGVPARLRAVG